MFFTTKGLLVREISLQSDITHPQSVCLLTDGSYGLVHESKLYHRYCVVDESGQLIKSYGSTAGSGVGQFSDPVDLVVNNHGFVFIVDYDNNRIAVLDPTLSTAQQLPVEGGLNHPYCINVDRSRSRLYIGEWEGKRLIVLGRMD